jgi:hypothetical protein
LRLEDAPFIEEPSADLIAEVEERMEAWAEETGVWLLFTVMTAIAQVMEMVRDAGDIADEAPA